MKKRLLLKRWLSRVFNKKMTTPVFFVAFFALISVVSSVTTSSHANYHKLVADASQSNWFVYYQDYLDNRENIDAANRMEQSRNDWITNSVESFNLDFVSGVYQITIQSSILSLMIFLVGFSIPKGKTLITVNLLAIMLLGMAVTYWVLATLQL
jgi:hypothetical protein